jgi:3-methylcrotonyl-CoA carboxylase alpha subunit
MPQIKKILIANRGEIALRIVRAAKKMNILSVVIYTIEDSLRLFVQEADEAILMEESSLESTFLNIPLIIEKALKTNTDAVYPGYGFLAENPDFARACINSNITWIGPSPESMQLMADKFVATEFAKSLSIPVIHSISGNIKELQIAAKQLLYPVLIKAIAGGGGRGMKIAYSENELPEMLDIASKEAMASFSNGQLIISDYLQSVRHIEVQVLGDLHGHMVHLFDRDCSIQRRHQKIIEETPSSAIPESVKESLYVDAIRLAKEAKYYSAGTIEFLIDQNNNYFFLEMNTRIQVEHPITEAITGIDLIEEQIKIAEGRKLSFTQNDIHATGHAIELRICAEDAWNNFAPSTGRISLHKIPVREYLRVDSDISQGNEINTLYDSLLSKVIVYGKNRKEARLNAIDILNNYFVHGVETNIPVLKEILLGSAFITNNFNTQYLNSELDNLKKNHQIKRQSIPKSTLIEATLAAWMLYNNASGSKPDNIWKAIGYWRHIMMLEIIVNNNTHFVEIINHSQNKIKLLFQEKLHEITFLQKENNKIEILKNDIHITFHYSFNYDGGIFISFDEITFYSEIKFQCYNNISFLKKSTNNELFKGNELSILAPIPGKILKINVSEGDEITGGNALLTIESMKTENRVLVNSNSKVVQIHVAEGDIIKAKQPLITLEPMPKS